MKRKSPPTPLRDKAIAMLKSGRYTKKDIQHVTGAHQVTVAEWFRDWAPAQKVRVVGYGRKPAKGVTPLLWEWAE